MKAADKVLTREDLIRRVKAYRGQGKTVAMANGLFDLVHVGHLRYLEDAAAYADVLVVAVNDDASARALKGPDRPIVPQGERAELIAGFGCVTLVTIFSEPTVEPLLRALVPDVHCKGTDYTADTVPEKSVALELGIRVAITGDPKNHATRDLISTIRGRAAAAAGRKMLQRWSQPYVVALFKSTWAKEPRLARFRSLRDRDTFLEAMSARHIEGLKLESLPDGSSVRIIGAAKHNLMGIVEIAQRCGGEIAFPGALPA